MVDIRITPELKQACPNTRLGVINSDIRYEKENSKLWMRLNR